jgi:hypothetical protein
MADEALMHAMALMPKDRYQSAGEMRGALWEAMSTPVQKTTPPTQVKPMSAQEVVQPVVSEAIDSESSDEVPSDSTLVVTHSEPAPARVGGDIKPERKSRWPLVLGVGILALVIIIGGFFFFKYDPFGIFNYPAPSQFEPVEREPAEPEPIEREPVEPEEPLPPEPAFDIGGLWVGGLEEAGGEHLFMDFVLEIHPDPDSNFFEGQEEIHTPDGIIRMRFEGFVEGFYFEFYDEENRHFRGEMEDEGRLGGEVFWDCFECELWAFFHLERK